MMRQVLSARVKFAHHPPDHTNRGKVTHCSANSRPTKLAALCLAPGGPGDGGAGKGRKDAEGVDVDFYESGWPCQVAIACFLVGSVAFSLDP
jgi:hypothetical protein